MTADIKVLERDGWTISLTDDRRFAASGPEEIEGVGYENGKTVDTYAEALDYIDRRTKAAATRVKIKLSLSAVAEDGTPCKLTGLHGSRGIILSVPPINIDRRMGADFYPDTPAVQALVMQRNQLRARLATAEARLASMEIKDRAGYNFKERNYEHEMKLFVDGYNKAVAEAKNLEEKP